MFLQGEDGRFRDATPKAMLERGEDLDARASDPPFRSYSRFLVQLEVVRKLIENGNPAGRKDAHGPMPPLSMPSWRTELSDDDVTAAIAYIISLYDWDEDEE